MVKIRLRRFGKRNTPVYRVVVADKRSPRDGRIIEEIGTYDPLLKKNNFTLKLDRVDYWLGVGARPSDRVARFLSEKGLVEKPAIPEQTKQHLPRAKTLERQQEAEDKAKKAAEAPKEEAAAEEAPAEEAKAEDAPAEDAKAEDATAKETKGEDAPAEDAKAEDAPAEDTKAEEKEEKKEKEDS